jgi:hypothetical protein
VTVNVIEELSGPVPSLFFVWIHQVYEPSGSELPAVTPQVVPEQTEELRYQVSITVTLEELSTFRRYSVAVVSLFQRKKGFPMVTVTLFGEIKVAAGGASASSVLPRCRSAKPPRASIATTASRWMRFRGSRRGELEPDPVFIRLLLGFVRTPS